MRGFRSLSVWSKSHARTLEVYACTRSFPQSERYGLVNQLQRATASIPSNLAEGCGRGSDADFARFVQIAMGSASEVEYQLLLSRDLGYIPKDQYRILEASITEIKRMLSGLLRRLRLPTESHSRMRAER